MPAEGRYQRFIQLLDGSSPGVRNQGSTWRPSKNEFARHFDDDPRFADLQYELAMHRADDYPGDAALVKEYEWALKLLQPDRRQP